MRVRVYRAGRAVSIKITPQQYKPHVESGICGRPGTVAPTYCIITNATSNFTAYRGHHALQFTLTTASKQVKPFDLFFAFMQYSSVSVLSVGSMPLVISSVSPKTASLL